MIFFDKTRTIGQDANGKNVVWVSVYVDTAANLPAYNDYQSDGFILCMASEGRCIDTGDLYRLDSAGSWQISQAGTGTYTKAEIDALLNEKQNTLTFDATPTQNSTNPVTSGGIWTDQQRQDALQTEDRASLIELVDGGAKNKFPYGDLIGITTNFADKPFSLPAGNYKINFTSSTSAGTFAVRLKDAQNNSIFYITANNTTTTRTYDLNISEDAAKITFYSSVSNDFTNIMICTSAAWEISQAFQPYRPSWQEMYEMILALQ